MSEQDNVFWHYAEQAAAATGVSMASIYAALLSVLAHKPIGPRQYEGLKMTAKLMNPTRPLYRDVPMNRAERRRRKEKRT